MRTSLFDNLVMTRPAAREVKPSRQFSEFQGRSTAVSVRSAPIRFSVVTGLGKRSSVTALPEDDTEVSASFAAAWQPLAQRGTGGCWWLGSVGAAAGGSA